jgi:hypothetical protein
MDEFLVSFNNQVQGCNQCNSTKKTYIIYPYFDLIQGHWCKDCWYEKMTNIQSKFLSVIMKYDNGFFKQKEIN